MRWKEEDLSGAYLVEAVDWPRYFGKVEPLFYF